MTTTKAKDHPMCLNCMFWASGVLAEGQCFLFNYAPIKTNFNDVCNAFKKKHIKEWQESLDKEGGA